MLGADLAVALGTVVMLLLYRATALQIWHLYHQFPFEFRERFSGSRLRKCHAGLWGFTRVGRKRRPEKGQAPHYVENCLSPIRSNTIYSVPTQKRDKLKPERKTHPLQRGLRFLITTLIS